MTEKVRVTREQAEMIKKHKEADNLERLLWKHRMLGCITCIDELTTQQVVDAYFDGYKVEPEFETGEWVVCEDGYIGQIEFINEIEKWANIGYSKDTKERGVCLATTYDLIDIIRHATPEEIAEEKQRRWWSKHDRNLWELKEGDILISKKKPHSCIVKFVEATDENATLLVDGIQDEFYEGSETLEYMREEYKVFCFVEDRKDLEDNS